MPNELVKEQAMHLALKWTPFNLRANKKFSTLGVIYPRRPF